MYGNMRVEVSDSDPVDSSCVCEFCSEETGWSPIMDRIVSAATMPPIECPMRIVCTEGSTVGEGVELATSRSMTLFCSHSLKRPTHS